MISNGEEFPESDGVRVAKEVRGYAIHVDAEYLLYLNIRYFHIQMNRRRECIFLFE